MPGQHAFVNRAGHLVETSWDQLPVVSARLVNIRNFPALMGFPSLSNHSSP
jgi:hypothetical protein